MRNQITSIQQNRYVYIHRYTPIYIKMPVRQCTKASRNLVIQGKLVLSSQPPTAISEPSAIMGMWGKRKEESTNESNY